MRVWRWFVGGIAAIGIGLVIWPLIAPGVPGGLTLIGIGIFKARKARRARQATRDVKMRRSLGSLILSAGQFLHHDFARPHASLKDDQGYPRTPAMAAGVKHHAWSLAEVAGLLDPN